MRETCVGPTDLPFSRAAPPHGEGRAARRLPRLTIVSAGAKCNRRDATELATAAAANGDASAATDSLLGGPLIQCQRLQDYSRACTLRYPPGSRISRAAETHL